MGILGDRLDLPFREAFDSFYDRLEAMLMVYCKDENDLVFVNAAVGASGDGRTWENAKKTIQEGLNTARLQGDGTTVDTVKGRHKFVFVYPGQYNEKILAEGYNIHLIGLPGWSNGTYGVVVNYNNAITANYVTKLLGAGWEISGITFAGAKAFPILVLGTTTGATSEGNYIHDVWIKGDASKTVTIGISANIKTSIFENIKINGCITGFDVAAADNFYDCKIKNCSFNNTTRSIEMANTCVNGLSEITNNLAIGSTSSIRNLQATDVIITENKVSPEISDAGTKTGMNTTLKAETTGDIESKIDDIITILGGAAIQLRTEQSVAGTVEENGVMGFGISLIDVDAGAIASADINITAISAVLEKSAGGAAFSSAGITQPTFLKANGLVSCNYQFATAEWEIGDIYKLAVSGITCTVGGDTAYVKTMIWSNMVMEQKNVETLVNTIITNVGNPSGHTLTSLTAKLGNDTSTLKARLDAIDTALTTIDDYVDTEVAAIKAVTDALPDAGALTTINTNINTINTNVGDAAAHTLTSLVAKLGNDTSTLKARLDAIDTALTTIDDYVDTEVAAIKAVTDAIPDAGALTTINTNINTANTNIGDASAHTLTSLVAKFGNDTATLKARLDAIDTALTTIDDYVDTEIAAIKAVTDALPDAGALTTINTNINTTNTNLGDAAAHTLTSLVAKFGNDTATLKARLDAIDTALTTIDDYIDTEIAAIKAISDALPDAGALTTINTNINTTNTNLGDAAAHTLTSLVAKFGNDTATLKARLDAIDTALTTIDDYIDTEVAAIKAVTDALPDAGALTTINTNVNTANTNIGSAAAHTLTSLVAKLGDDTLTVKARLDAIDTALTTIDNYVDTEVAAIIAQLDPTVTSSSYSYTDAGGVQDIVAVVNTKRVHVHGILVDCTTLTQNGTLSFLTKIDGTNYRRCVPDQAFVVATDDSVYMRVDIVTDKDFKFTWTEGGDEGADRALPYKLSYSTRN